MGRVGHVPCHAVGSVGAILWAASWLHRGQHRAMPSPASEPHRGRRWRRTPSRATGRPRSPAPPARAVPIPGAGTGRCRWPRGRTRQGSRSRLRRCCSAPPYVGQGEIKERPPPLPAGTAGSERVPWAPARRCQPLRAWARLASPWGQPGLSSPRAGGTSPPPASPVGTSPGLGGDLVLPCTNGRGFGDFVVKPRVTFCF